jgi:CheY-like chemotaxis protein
MRIVKKKNVKDDVGRAHPARLAPPLSITVLHIDDDPKETELLRAAVQQAAVPFNFLNVEDGEQAIMYLSGKGPYTNRALYPLPSLVLLDLKMPRATGFEILKWIRCHPELGELPVLVLSGSELQDDIRRAYAVGANSYHVKPLGFDALVSLVKDINASWVGTMVNSQTTLP